MDVIEWARESLLIDLLPWQEWFLVHALELLPNGPTGHPIAHEEAPRGC